MSILVYNSEREEIGHLWFLLLPVSKADKLVTI
jgi:hypothetical protein